MALLTGGNFVTSGRLEIEYHKCILNLINLKNDALKSGLDKDEVKSKA